MAQASDVNMSSEGSVGSRLRQFGLYKTIDSRTEEFLKLSRKRQIRRGCACAVVSTAITVTVVVSVLLVYKHGFRKDARTPTATLWFNVVNNSDGTTQKKTDNDNNDNYKLLPLILKALDQKANGSKNCNCSKSLQPVIKQLQETIQQLRPKDINKTVNTTEVRHTTKLGDASEHYTVVYNVQNKSSIGQSNYTTAPSERKKTSTFRTSRKPRTFKAASVNSKAGIIDKKDKVVNPKNKLKKLLTHQHNGKYRNNTHKKETTFQKSHLKLNDRNSTTTTTSTTDTTIIKSNVSTENTAWVNISPNAIKPNDKTTVKPIQYIETFNFDGDEYKDREDFNEIGNLQPKSKQYYITHVNNDKGEIFDYMDSLSKIYGKTFFINKPHSISPADVTTKTFDLKKYFSDDIFIISQGSDVKVTKPSTETQRTVEPIQLFKANLIKENSGSTQKSVESHKPPPSTFIRANESVPSSIIQTSRTPYTRFKFDLNKNYFRKTRENLLFPVSRSYLEKKEKEVVNTSE